jgi:hypothetical protein
VAEIFLYLITFLLKEECDEGFSGKTGNFEESGKAAKLLAVPYCEGGAGWDFHPAVLQGSRAFGGVVLFLAGQASARIDRIAGPGPGPIKSVYPDAVFGSIIIKPDSLESGSGRYTLF